jgi:hypothetical protein
MKNILPIILWVVFSLQMPAQHVRDEGTFENGRWSIATEAGLSLWDGDFDPDRTQSLRGLITSPVLGISMEYNLSPMLSAGLMLGGYLFNQEDPNESFYSRGLYVAPYVSTDVLGLLHGQKLRYWSLWLSAGVGNLNPIRTTYTRTIIGSNPVTTRVAPPASILFIPLSLNLERKISPAVSLGLAGRFNVSNSDVIDGVMRGSFNDHSESLVFSVRYRLLPESKQHMRDAKFVYQTPAIRTINKNLGRISELELKVDSLQNRLQKTEEKLLQLEKSK